MRRARTARPLFLCRVLLALVLSAAIDARATAGPPEAIDFGGLHDGDIVLRHAQGRWSNYFRDASPNERRFSHIGIIVHEAADIHVIHADASDVTGMGRVRRELLTTFLDHATDWAVFRVRGSEAQRASIAAEARSFLGTPFDARFDADDASRVYCTELVYLAVNRALGVVVISPTECQGRRLVFLDACYRGAAFTTVIEHQRPTP